METGARLLDGRYELGAVLASGGMGRVWRGRDTVLNRAVAVKVLRNEFTGDDAFLARFRAEAQHAAALHHPHIAAVFDYGEVVEEGERLAYLVMELVDGESLAALLARQRRLDVDTALRVVRDTSAALAVAHRAGLVHRDVKPGNVLVTREGLVKITDFGIAFSASSVPLTRTGQVIGTAHYLSPEQAQGDRATSASDVYALGAVAYECLAGRRVFEGENSVQIAVKHIREDPEPLPREIPRDVRALVERALEKDPARRFADGAELLRAVDDVLARRRRSSPAAADSRSSAETQVVGGSSAAAAVPGPPGGDGDPDRTAVMPAPLLPPARGSAGARSSTGRRRATALLLGALGALLLIAAVVVGAVVLGNGDGGTPDAAPSTGVEETSAPGPTTAAPTTAAPTTAEPTPEAIRLDLADYLGRPLADVQADLAARDLVVAVQPVQTADVGEGTVTDVTPLDGLTAGSTVTVSYAVAPPPPAVEDDGGDGGGQGDGQGDGGGGQGDDGDADDGGGGGNGNGNGNGRGRGNGGD